jgi:taurine dioxygenase
VSLDITPLSEALGAEVRGLDLRGELDAATVAELTDAWHEHIVLVFRDQDLDEDAQLRFAARFGTLGERARPPERRPEGVDYNAAVMLISNVRENGVAIGSLPDGEMWFHHDMSYTEKPYKGTMLYAMEIPATGGNTKFANMYKAYDRLAPATRERIAGMRALHIYDFALRETVDISGDITRYKHQIQPIAVRHPVTGRKALYVSPLITARIQDTPEDEGAALLDELFAFTRDPEVILEHVWRQGDLAMWDNWCSCHARTDFPGSERRLLRRCTILGQPLYE